MERYRAAIVGCGRIGSLFSKDPLRKGVVTHAAAYKRNRKTELIAACDIDKKRLEDFGKTWGVGSLYTDFEKMIRKEHIDILSICTWDSTHYGLLKKAAKRGLKAVFCEKPISNNLKMADEMVKICGRKGIVFAVNHSRRWDIFEQRIRDYIVLGKLGSIQNVSACYTGGIMNTGTHLFDLLRFLLGDAAWVWANPQARVKAVDPVLDGYIYFKNGFGCSLQGLNARDYLIFEIDIYGTKGRIRIKNSGFDMKLWKVASSPRFSGYKELKEIKPLFRGGYRDVLKNAVSDIVDCIEKKQAPFSSGEDGVRALEIICALHASANCKGKIIMLPLAKRDISIVTR